MKKGEERDEGIGEEDAAGLTDNAGPKPAARTSYRRVAVVGIFTLVSRIAGLAREATRAHFLGVGMASDAFQIAFQLPSILRRLVGEGAVSSAMVPVFSDYVENHTREEERDLAERFLNLWFVLVLAVTLAGVFGGAYFVSLAFRWGSFADAAKRELTADLTSILFWYLLLVGFAAAIQGVLNARDRFVASSASPLLFNLAFVVTGWLIAPRLEQESQVYALAGGVLVGGLLQLAILLPSAWNLGLRPRICWPLGHEGVRRILRLFVPAVFGAGIYQINVLVSSIIAASLATQGSVAVLSYSGRLMEVVLGVFVFALSTVSLTSLSRQAAAGRMKAYSDNLVEVLRLVLIITIPSAVGLYLLCEPILGLLLGGGAFDAEALRMTAGAFRFHVPGLIFVGLNRVLVNAFYALEDVRTPVRIAAVNLVFNLSLAAILSAGSLSYAGIALAASLAAVLQTAMLFSRLRPRTSGVGLRRLLPVLWRCLLAAAVMGAIVHFGGSFLELDGGKFAMDRKITTAWKLAVLISSGAAIYFGVAKWLGVRELSTLIARFRGSSM